jgi:hypothetical protein
MSIDIIADMPKWAPVEDAVEIGFLVVNRGPSGVYVNRRCAVGHAGSGAEIAIQVFDRHGRSMRSRKVEISPPPLHDFVWLEPGARAYGDVYDVLRDFELPLGQYTIELVFRRVDAIPAELAGRPVHTEMILLDRKRLDVIPWGAPPPVYDTSTASS